MLMYSIHIDVYTSISIHMYVCMAICKFAYKQDFISCHTVKYSSFNRYCLHSFRGFQLQFVFYFIFPAYFAMKWKNETKWNKNWKKNITSMDSLLPFEGEKKKKRKIHASTPLSHSKLSFLHFLFRLWLQWR